MGVISSGLQFMGQGAAMAGGSMAASKVLGGGSQPQTVQGGQTQPINNSPLVQQLFGSTDVTTSGLGGNHGK